MTETSSTSATEITVAVLWLACVTAIAAGAEPAHEQAKAELRRGADGARRALWAGAAFGRGRSGHRRAS